MFATDVCGGDFGGFAGFGEGVVAGVEVFAFLMVGWVSATKGRRV